MYWSIDTYVPADDKLLKRLCLARDIACWAMLGMMLVCALVNPFFPIGIPGAVLFVVFVFAAMGTSIAVVAAPFWRAPRPLQ